MKYFCSNCSYFYDELVGDSDMQIEAGTNFETLPNDFFCPFCDTHKDDFVVFENEIHKPISFNNLTSIEVEHIPDYEVKGDILTYKLEHDIKKDHFITKIELYDDSGDFIDKHIFTKESDEIAGVFDLDYMDGFEFRVYCARDGVFSSGVIEIE